MHCRAVLLDFFNTLTTAVRRGPGHDVIARQLGCDPVSWLEALDATYHARARGAYGTAIEGLRRVARLCGAEPSSRSLAEAVEARVAVLDDDVELRPEAVPVLRTLRRMGLRTAVVSDCWFELPVLLPRLPIANLLDARTFSVRVGATKPHPAMYLSACERLGVEPYECLYLGDGGNHELTGARMLGMTAVQLTAPDLGSHLTFDAEADWDGPEISTLAELPELVIRVPAPV
jgi:putative hydrolase of the HAD superfamily